MASTIEVLSRRDVFSPDPQRVGKLDVLVVYRVDVDPTQSFFVTLPKEAWSEPAEQEAITKAESGRRMVQPRKFTIP